MFCMKEVCQVRLYLQQKPILMFPSLYHDTPSSSPRRFRITYLPTTSHISGKEELPARLLPEESNT